MQNHIQERKQIYENDHLTLLTARLHRHMERYGYQNAQLPAIEAADLFLSKAGDQVIANLLSFERFGKQLALRPEFTALAVHRYVQQHPASDAITRWQFNGSVFLDDYSSRDSQYQYMSIGAEIFGMKNAAYADAEIIYLAASGLVDIAGLNVQVRIGHVGVIRSIIQHYNLDDRTSKFLLKYAGAIIRDEMSVEDLLNKFDQYLAPPSAELVQSEPDDPLLQQNTQQMLDTLLNANQRGYTMGGRTRDDIVQRLVRKRHRASERRQVQEAAHHLSQLGQLKGSFDTIFPQMRAVLSGAGLLTDDLLAQWQKTIETLLQMGIPPGNIHIAPGLLRGWDYYTGIVFDVVGASGQSYGGGGRYDELAQLMGSSTHVPAVGFAYDVSAIISDMSVEPQTSFNAIALVIGDNNLSQSLTWQRTLHSKDQNVILVENDTEVGTIVLRVDENEYVQYKGEVYSLDKVNALLRAIEVNS